MVHKLLDLIHDGEIANYIALPAIALRVVGTVWLAGRLARSLSPSLRHQEI